MERGGDCSFARHFDTGIGWQDRHWTVAACLIVKEGERESALKDDVMGVVEGVTGIITIVIHRSKGCEFRQIYPSPPISIPTLHDQCSLSTIVEIESIVSTLERNQFRQI